MRSSLPPQLLCLSAIFLCLSYSYAQTTNGRANSQQDLQNREWALGHMRDEVRNQSPRDNKLSQAQLREDFRQLQIVNNGLMKRVFIQKTCNPKDMRSALGEMRKLASRLRVNFAFSEKSKTTTDEIDTETKPDPSTATTGLSSDLLRLDQTVMRFVTNPLFQDLRVLDSSLVARADKDLDEILRLTESLDGELKRGVAVNRSR